MAYGRVNVGSGSGNKLVIEQKSYHVKDSYSSYNLIERRKINKNGFITLKIDEIKTNEKYEGTKLQIYIDGIAIKDELLRSQSVITSLTVFATDEGKINIFYSFDGEYTGARSKIVNLLDLTGKEVTVIINPVNANVDCEYTIYSR